MKNIILICVISILACSNVPVKECKTTLWHLATPVCLERIDQDDNIIRVCPGDKDYPKDITGITIKQFNCELGYQDKLVLKCKKFNN